MGDERGFSPAGPSGAGHAPSSAAPPRHSAPDCGPAAGGLDCPPGEGEGEGEGKLWTHLRRYPPETLVEAFSFVKLARSYNYGYAEFTAALETQKKTTERNARFAQRHRAERNSYASAHRRTQRQKKEEAAPDNPATPTK